mgnify:CR=1 FL=1
MNKNITIKFIQDFLGEDYLDSSVDDETSRRMWWCALEVIQKDFLSNTYQDGGVWVASPLPAIKEKKYLNKLKGWLWAPEGFPYSENKYAGYLPGNSSKYENQRFEYLSNYKIMKITAEDGFEPFLMIITPNFQCVLSIVGEKYKRNLIMRSDEETIQKSIELVISKLMQENPKEASKLRDSIINLGKLQINEKLVRNFWQKLSITLANLIPSFNLQQSFAADNNKTVEITEAKLLEAISHEVRTPLTTIRTLISSTLRKYKMDESMRSRLIQIDNECTEQIDRFGLIFNAAELVSGQISPPEVLTSINLGEILNKLSPYWIKQLERRGISLKLVVPDELPEVLSNSEKLELMLGGLIDKNTRGLNEGSTLILELRPAGQKLKLQLIVLKKGMQKKEQQINLKQKGSDIGLVLNWNPQTGSLQISQSATQKLLASLGGHVTKRRDTGLTVFFPISEKG